MWYYIIKEIERLFDFGKLKEESHWTRKEKKANHFAILRQ